MLLDKIRELRQIEGAKFTGCNEHVLFLGTFNAEKHIEGIRGWLPLQFSRNRVEHLVIVDNSSPEKGWNLLLDLSRELREQGWQLLLVRNPINLGGWGSLATNLDLLDSFTWVTTFHQDDQYAADHAVQHHSVARRSPSQVAMIASEAVSMDTKGKVLGYPRASWLLPTNQKAHETFSSLVRFHHLPFSGATFRVQFLSAAKAPWLSSTFPDTEILLEGLPGWEYLLLDEPKVSYTENEVSESHGLSHRQREFGAARALLRVFNGEGFVDLIRTLNDEEFEAFCESTLSSLRLRLTSSDLYLLTSSHLLDVASNVRSEAGWTAPLGKMAELFHSTEDKFGEELCLNLDAGPPFMTEAKKNGGSSSANFGPILPRSRQRLRFLTLRIMGTLPQSALRFLWVKLLRSKFGRGKWPNWDF